MYTLPAKGAIKFLQSTYSLTTYRTQHYACAGNMYSSRLQYWWSPSIYTNKIKFVFNNLNIYFCC